MDFDDFYSIFSLLFDLLPNSRGTPVENRWPKGWTAEGSPFDSRFISSPRHPDRFWGLPRLLCNVVPGAHSPGVKRLWREADHSPPTSVEVMNTWIYTSTLRYVFGA
jgi:hypothetical protein